MRFTNGTTLTLRSGLLVEIPAELFDCFADMRRGLVLAVYNGHMASGKTTTQAAYATMSDVGYSSDSSVYAILRDEKTLAVRGEGQRKS